jgi:hypothetical protein
VWSHGFTPKIRKFFYVILSKVVLVEEDRHSLEELLVENASNILRELIRKDGTLGKYYAAFDTIDKHGEIVSKAFRGYTIFAGEVIEEEPYANLNERF